MIMRRGWCVTGLVGSAAGKVVGALPTRPRDQHGNHVRWCRLCQVDPQSIHWMVIPGPPPAPSESMPPRMKEHLLNAFRQLPDRSAVPHPPECHQPEGG
jgi:hypothetical protein